MKYVISDVAFSGNKGASGMTVSLMQNLLKKDSSNEFMIFSYYPEADKESRERLAEATIFNGTPKKVVMLFFLGCWAWLCRKLHLPKSLWKHGEFGKMADADYWLDASGISFVDGREKFIIFNFLSIFPALSSGVPIVKVAQAMGPFNNKLNRLAAKIILPKIKLIVARGDITASHLEELKLGNVVQFSDIAFSLKCLDSEITAIESYLPKNISKGVIGISPSQVVYKLCSSLNIDYLGILAEYTKEMAKQGYSCLIFPHSARTGTLATHNNDLLVIQKMQVLLGNEENITIISDELSAGELRALIGRCQILVASRFHAIISAMSMGIPTLVIGWSHKYSEVLAPFEMDRFVIPYKDLTPQDVVNKSSLLLNEREMLAAKIKDISSTIVNKNEDFFGLIEK